MSFINKMISFRPLIITLGLMFSAPVIGMNNPVIHAPSTLEETVWDTLESGIEQGSSELEMQSKLSHFIRNNLIIAHQTINGVLHFDIETLQLQLNLKYMNLTLSIFDKSNNKVGNIFLILSAVTDLSDLDELAQDQRFLHRIERKHPHMATLMYIHIDEKYRGKSYSTLALKLLHEFLDTIDTDFTFLTVESEMPYTGKIYKNMGYEFTQKTLDCIEDWAKKQHLSLQDSENEFLKDTTVLLPTNCYANMIRYGTKEPSFKLIPQPKALHGQP